MGADGYFALVNQTESVGAHYGLHPYRVRHLLDRYGSLIGEVLPMAEGRPELLTPITEAPVYLKVEAWYAAAAEGALHLEDILARRMRISIEYPHRGVDCAREVAEVVAPVLGWSEEDIDREVSTYIARVDAEVRVAAAARRRIRRRAAGRGAGGARGDPRAGAAQLRRRRRCRCATGSVRRGCGCGAGRCSTSCASGSVTPAAAKVLAGEVVDADGSGRHGGHGDAGRRARVLLPGTARRGAGAVRHAGAVSRRRHRRGRQAAFPGDDAAGHGTSRRPRWCGCGANSICRSCRPRTGWTG